MNRKYTKEIVTQLLLERLITFSGDYTSTKKRTDFRCLKCGHPWTVRIGNVLEGTGCSKCVADANRERILLPHQEYVQRLSEVTTSIIPTSEYLGMKEHSEHTCLVCDWIWSPVPESIIRGSGCPKCWERKNAYDIYKNTPTVLYLLSIPDVGVKPGITKTGIKIRYESDNTNLFWNINVSIALWNSLHSSIQRLERNRTGASSPNIQFLSLILGNDEGSNPLQS